MIGLCIDSSAQLPPLLVERYGIEVVPLTVRLDDREYLEGLDLSADDFYGRFSNGHPPAVATAPPSPGQFALAYEHLAERGKDEILSVHAGAAVSGELSNARLGARHAPVPVRLVDTGTGSFGVACCAWVAAEAIALGVAIDEAAQLAERTSTRIGNAFLVVGGDDEPVEVMSTAADGVEVLGRVLGLTNAIDVVAAYALGWIGTTGEGPLKVAIGTAGPDTVTFGERLDARLRAADAVGEIVHYRIGPSIAAHTGPRTAGVFFFR